MADKKRQQRYSQKDTQTWRSRNAILAEELANELSIHTQQDANSEPIPDLPADANIGTSSDEERARTQLANSPAVPPTSNDDVYSALAQAAVNTDAQNENIPTAQGDASTLNSVDIPGQNFEAAMELTPQEDDALTKAERQAMAALDHDLYGIDMEASMEEDISGVSAMASRNPQLSPDDVKRQTEQESSGMSFVAQQESTPVQDNRAGAQAFAQVNEFAPVSNNPPNQETLPQDMSSAQNEAPQEQNQPSSYQLGSLEYEDQADFGPLYDAGYDMEVASLQTNPLPNDGLMRSTRSSPVRSDPATITAWADFDTRASIRRPAQDEAAAFFRLSGGPFPSLLKNQGQAAAPEDTTTSIASTPSSEFTPNEGLGYPQTASNPTLSDAVEEEGDLAVPVEDANPQ